jgi:hypothetical protein
MHWLHDMRVRNERGDLPIPRKREAGYKPPPRIEYAAAVSKKAPQVPPKKGAPVSMDYVVKDIAKTIAEKMTPKLLVRKQ